MDKLLECSGLTKIYKETLALHELDLEVSRGEIVGLLGPNGAGKTTAIHIFLGLLKPTKGKISLLGYSPLKERSRIAPKINFSSAYTQLPNNLKVIENLCVFARLYGIKNRKQKVEYLLDLFNMSSLAYRLTGALSSGEKTRLNLCKCLLNDPELLLLDEPTASLDPEMADHVRSILRQVHQETKMGILFTSHNMLEVEQVCHRILFIHHGRVIARGDADGLKKKYGAFDLDQVFIKIVRSQE